MQTRAETQTPAPPLPPPPATIVVVGADGKSRSITVPRTADEIRGLQARREQLSNQLESVADRRSELAEELTTTGAEAARPGLEARIGLLDQRILQLESDLATTGQQLAMAAPALVASTESEDTPPPQGEEFVEGALAGGFSVLGFFAILLFITRRRWKRGASGRFAQLGADSSQRLERLEQGMDAIAIEIERVSEGQRFVTRLLSEQHGAQDTSNRAAQPTVLESVDRGSR